MQKKKLLFTRFFFFGLFFPFFSVAGTIVSPHKYAWSDNAGYINFENVIVGDGALSGYAWSANKGFIKFNPAQGGVFNDGTGNLSGFAWGEGLGWIDFNNVNIGGNGKFSGTATGSLVGTLTFGCPNYCDVETDWRPSANAVLSAVSQNAGAVLLPAAPRPIEPESADIVPEAESAPLPQASPTGAPLDIPPSGEEEPATPVSEPPNSVTVSTENPPLFDVISEPASTRVDTSSAGLTMRVAPGEILPISVKLANFGGGKRVDVLVKYSIINSAGDEIYSTNETVAVETTANFVKTIQIPFSTPPGNYIAKTSIIYGGQEVPATTQFPFIVEQKILGLFRSEFFLYGGITLLVSIFAGLFGYALVKRRRQSRFAPIDYSDVPKEDRIFYELISDTVMSMRQKVGDDALDIASGIDGLVIDEKTGRVLKLTRFPSKVVADLVSGYEKSLGKKVSFSFRKEKSDS
jgi:hypothetical protein